MDAKAKKPQKMIKIACILVRDIRRIDLIKIEITQSVFKILNFAGQILDIDLGLKTNLATKFWILLQQFGNSMNDTITKHKWK